MFVAAPNGLCKKYVFLWTEGSQQVLKKQDQVKKKIRFGNIFTMNDLFCLKLSLLNKLVLSILRECEEMAILLLWNYDTSLEIVVVKYFQNLANAAEFVRNVEQQYKKSFS